MLGPSYYHFFLYDLCCGSTETISHHVWLHCMNIVQNLLWMKAHTSVQQWQGQRDGEKGCHHAVLRGHAEDTSACSWCAMKRVLVWFTRKRMESGGRSRETVAPSAQNRQSDGCRCGYVLKRHSSISAKQSLSMYQEQNLLHAQASLHLRYKFPKLYRIWHSSFSI